MITPEQIPSTARSPEFLAKQYGHESVKTFAESFEKNAFVADVGAGVSQLGRVAAGLRPDINWFNIDPCYDDPAIRSNIGKHSKNLHFVPLDITSDTIDNADLKGKFNHVFSYWMLPHLSLETDDAALAAVRNMHALLAPDGHITVGPTRKLGAGLFSPIRYKGSRTYPQHLSSHVVAREVLVATKLWWLPRHIQRLSNTHNVHLGMHFVGGTKKSS